MNEINDIFIALAILAVAIAGASIGALIMYLAARKASVQTPAPLHFVRAWKPFSQEQIAMAFREWPDDERWKALWDLLSFHLEAELDSQQAAAVSAEEIMQRAGRIQMMLFLRSQFLELRRKP